MGDCNGVNASENLNNGKGIIGIFFIIFSNECQKFTYSSIIHYP